jgi:hypothetical protein
LKNWEIANEWIKEVESYYEDFKKKREPHKQKNPHKESPYVFSDEEPIAQKRRRSIIRDDNTNQSNKRRLEEPTHHLSLKMAKFLSILFENTRPVDIAEVRKFYITVGDVNDTDSVPKQLRYLAKSLVGVSIPDFINVLKGVVAQYPANRLELLLDKYKENLEGALLAEDYDNNEQRTLLGQKLTTPKTRKWLSQIALITDVDLPTEELDKKFEKKRKRKLSNHQFLKPLKKVSLPPKMLLK